MTVSFAVAFAVLVALGFLVVLLVEAGREDAGRD
jgi:hypothetical protein